MSAGDEDCCGHCISRFSCHPRPMLPQELHRRLLIYYAQAEEGMAPMEGPLLLAYEDPLPLEDFYEVRQAQDRGESHDASVPGGGEQEEEAT